MVPDSIVPGDSDEVRELIDDGFIESRHPGMGAYRIYEPFRDLVARHGDELGRKFSARIVAWDTLDHVHMEKMEERLIEDLVACGLAQINGPWLGMQPQLASVYMTALAEAMAPMIGARPVAETPTNHIAVSGLTIERLADSLLHLPQRRDRLKDKNEIEVAMASLAMSYIIPDKPETIPAKAINKFRKEFVEERAQFQLETMKLVEGLEYLKEARDLRDIEKHLRNAYEKGPGQRLSRLKKGMARAGWDTIDGATAASFAIPQGLANALHAMGLNLTGAIASAAGIAFTGWTLWRKYEKTRIDLLKPTSEAFLYRLERSLAPRALADSLSADSQKFLPYV